MRRDERGGGVNDGRKGCGVSELVCAVASGVGRDQEGRPFPVRAGRTRIALETLLGIEDPGTVELFGFDSGVRTPARTWQLPEPSARSRSCEPVSVRSRSEHQVTVSLRRMWDALRGFAQASRDGRETGGFLFGPHVRSWHNRIVITSATEAAMERQPTRLKLDLEQHVLRDMAWIRASRVDDTFGEAGFWHTHPNERVATPSQPDLAAWLSGSDWLGRPYLGLILTAEATDQRWTHPHVSAWITRREVHGRAICEPVDVDL